MTEARAGDAATAALLTLLAGYAPRPCGDAQAHQDGHRPMLDPRLDHLHQSGRDLDAVSWECCCGWRRTEAMRRHG